MSNILQGKEEYFTLIQKYSHYQSVGRMIEYNQIKGKGGERAVSEYVLELKGITKIFPGVKALNNVQFQLKPGEVHALMRMVLVNLRLSRLLPEYIRQKRVRCS